MEHDAKKTAMSGISQQKSLQALTTQHGKDHPGQNDTPVKINVRNLNFFYGQTHALKNINLDFHDRCVTALIGPSGCGKSTLLRVFNRIYELYPDQRATGEVVVDGQNILGPAINLAQLRIRIGMTFQRPNPFPMSIYDNIAFGIRLHRKLSRKELDATVEKALRGAALWDEVKDILTRNAYALSGGQQQRLCIARAIALDPEILLFDEPCSALDPISTLSIENLLDELAHKYCVVIITHNMEEAARVSRYAAFMYLGEVIEYGATEQIFVNPKDGRTNAYVTGRLIG